LELKTEKEPENVLKSHIIFTFYDCG